MSIIAYIIVGLIAGFLAKMVMPGTRDEPSGFLMTMVLGIVGAVLGGWVWNLVLNQPTSMAVSIGSILVAFVGSCIVIGVMRLFTHGRTANY